MSIANPCSNGHPPNNRVGGYFDPPAGQAKKQIDFCKLYAALGLDFTAREGEVQCNCPLCDGPRFYFSSSTGLWECKHKNNCGAVGNHWDLIRQVYKAYLAAPSDKLLHKLRDQRGLSLPTLKRWGVAIGPAGCFLIPAMSATGKVLNLQRYWPKSRDKYWLPGLPVQPFGRQFLDADATTPIWICEGVWDAMAVDQRLHGMNVNKRYSVVAVPSAGMCKPTWFKDYPNREWIILGDRDEAGCTGANKVADVLSKAGIGATVSMLKWPSTVPAEIKDISDLLAAEPELPLPKFVQQNTVEVGIATPSILFEKATQIEDDKTEWMADGCIPFGSFVSLAGFKGVHKSDLARYFIAMGTQGKPILPGVAKVAAFNCCYFTSEDSGGMVKALVELAGGDLKRLTIVDYNKMAEPPNLLEKIAEVEAHIRATGAKLVVIDALHSFIESGVLHDSQARRHVIGPLHALARRTGACILGLRNHAQVADAQGKRRTMGNASTSDVARCVMDVTNTSQHKNDRPQSYQIEFVVNGAPPINPIPFWVEDMQQPNAKFRRVVRFDEVAKVTENVKQNTSKKAEQKTRSGHV